MTQNTLKNNYHLIQVATLTYKSIPESKKTKKPKRERKSFKGLKRNQILKSKFAIMRDSKETCQAGTLWVVTGLDGPGVMLHSLPPRREDTPLRLEVFLEEYFTKVRKPHKSNPLHAQLLELEVMLDSMESEEDNE